jgi:hypothetical protein
MISKIQPDQLSLTRDCAFAFFKESQLPGQLDFEHWTKAWTNLINLNLGEVFAYFHKGEIVGILGGMFCLCTMTAELEALEGFWFVQPEFRKGMGGIKLLWAFQNEAMKRGCKRIKMAHLMSVNPDEVASLYRKMDFKILQVHYSKEL